MKIDKYDVEGFRAEPDIPAVMTYEEFSEAFDALVLWAKAEAENDIDGTSMDDLEELLGKFGPVILVPKC